MSSLNKLFIPLCLTFYFWGTNQLSGNTIQPDTLIVSKHDTGCFTSISGAIASLPMFCYQRVVIVVKNGIYTEKVKIDRDYITLLGQNPDSTIISYSQLRTDWDKNPDAIGPAVVNIFADDIVLQNITIINTQPQIGPHAFAIYGTGTRTIMKNCKAISKGGDTVALWNYKTGMYYHDSCFFEGAVDFVCPRGWCYISNSTFSEVKNTAAIWHAAPVNPNQKFVLFNCTFSGTDSFYLARHHYDAQFYFIKCTFSQFMRNKPIEHVFDSTTPHKNRPYLYGHRHYFYNCNRLAGNYTWFANNYGQWPQQVLPQNITPSWTFDNAWDPLDCTPLNPVKKEIKGRTVFIWFDQLVMATGKLVLVTSGGDSLYYTAGNGRNRLEFNAKVKLDTNVVHHPFNIVSGIIQSIEARVEPKKALNNL